jgi:hypothetical protein
MNFKYSNANKNAYNKAANSNNFTPVPKAPTNNGTGNGPKSNNGSGPKSNNGSGNVFVNAPGNLTPNKYTNLNSWLNSLNTNTRSNKVKLSNKYTNNVRKGKINFQNANYQAYVKNTFPNLHLNGSAPL